MIPSGRTAYYNIWDACARFKIKPPGVKDNWEDCDVITQGELLAYSIIKTHEEFQVLETQIKATGAKVF